MGEGEGEKVEVVMAYIHKKVGCGGGPETKLQ